MLWREHSDELWRTGADLNFSPADEDEADPDGAWLLDVLLDDIVERYLQYMDEVYQISLDRAAVKHVVARYPLTESVIRALRVDRDPLDVGQRRSDWTIRFMFDLVRLKLDRQGLAGTRAVVAEAWRTSAMTCFGWRVPRRRRRPSSTWSVGT